MRRHRTDPVERLLFAADLGGYWAGVYEPVTWHRPQRVREEGKDNP